MESTAWTQLHNVMNARSERRPFARATLRRIGGFARPHRRRIIQFVLLGVATALLAVATPVLAGRVVDAIVSGGDERLVVRLALLIALIALAEAGLGLLGGEAGGSVAHDRDPGKLEPRDLSTPADLSTGATTDVAPAAG